MADIHTSFIIRLRSHFKLKLFLFSVISVLIMVPYFLLQRYPFFSVTIMPASFIDKLIPFNDSGIWLYHSMSFLTSLVTLLFIEKEKLVQYTLGIILISVVSCFFFLFVPTECQRPSSTETCALYKWFTKFESPLNAFPSMHVGLTIYTALAATYYMEMKKIWNFIIWCWALAIVYSTLLTKQHVILDVMGGALLAIITYRIGIRNGVDNRFSLFFNKICMNR